MAIHPECEGLGTGRCMHRTPHGGGGGRGPGRIGPGAGAGCLVVLAGFVLVPIAFLLIFLG
jgi:hypothetical protein